MGGGGEEAAVVVGAWKKAQVELVCVGGGGFVKHAYCARSM